MQGAAAGKYAGQLLKANCASYANGLAPHAFHMGMYEKRLTFLSVSVAPEGIEMLILWNDFRKVVKFIDEPPWVKSLLEKIIDKRS